MPKAKKVKKETLPETDPLPQPEGLAPETEALPEGALPVKKVKKKEIEALPVEALPVEKVKKKRKPSAYSLFVQKLYHTEAIMALPSRDRFKAISVQWSEHKDKTKST